MENIEARRCGTEKQKTLTLVKVRLEKKMEAYEDKGFSGVVLVADQGKVILERSYGMADYGKNIPKTVNTAFRIGSISKSFTALCIMMLQEQGLLHVQDKVSQYIPDFPNGDKISIHHLLSMSSGITNEVKGILPKYDYNRGIYINDGQSTRKDEHFTPTELIGLFREKPLNFKPGEAFEYSNSNYILLGYIIEKVSGMSYGDFVTQQILVPLDMLDSGVDGNDMKPAKAVGYDRISPEPVPTFSYDMSIFYGFGGLYSTVEDLFKWDRALRTEKLVKKETLETIFKPHTKMKGTPYLSYGYGWIVHELAKKPQAEHNGELPGFTSYIYREEEPGRAVIILCNNMAFSSELASLSADLIGELKGVLW